MELYNSFIRRTEELLDGKRLRKWDYEPGRCWPDAGKNQLIMQREAAYELGNGKKAVSFTCATTYAKLVGRDEIFLYGPDLTELKADSVYARIVFMAVQDIGEEDEAFRTLQDIDFAKYKVFPEGYMMRALAEDNREQVRVSKSAVSKGISFEKVGCSYIAKYKENPNVRFVRIIYITDPTVDFAELKALARKSNDVTNSLSSIFNGIPTDCEMCGLRELCDEVDGMRELHFQQKAKK